VLADLAKQAGLAVTMIRIRHHQFFKNSQKTGVNITKLALSEMGHFDVMIDALLGIGIQNDVSADYQYVIEQINAIKKPVLSIDVPSGIDADTGNVMAVAVKADVTSTFLGNKQGLYTGSAPAYCGDIICDDLQLPNRLFSSESPSAELIAWQKLQHHLPKRQRDAHKGRYGHTLVIGGDYGMGGAVRMAAEAALRVGSGLVSVATRPEHAPVVCSDRPEIMCHQVSNAEDLKPLLEKASVVVIGPGLGKSDWAQTLLGSVLTRNYPTVLDADALNLLSQHPLYSDHWILTPHPGEAARLLNISTEAIQADRFSAAQRLQEKFGGVVILKGPGTIVQSSGNIPKICPAGNPGMATGGMGDVLSGIIGGLLAQKISLTKAAELAVMIHAIAADQAASEGGERGLLASDLMSRLRDLVNPQ
jgi:hydroxyethylthiazole kinase-like uncharacterized protein yjeF